MIPHAIAVVSLLSLSTVAILGGRTPEPIETGTSLVAKPAGQTLVVDGLHSNVLFRIKHLQTSNFYGFFNRFKGTIQYDEQDITKSSVDLEIDATSIYTANRSRDNHLKGSDFLSATEFPTITFKSKRVKALEGNRFEVVGDVTLRGKTNEEVMSVELTGSSKNFEARNDRVGFEGRFTLMRSKYGINYQLANEALSDAIHVIVSLQTKPR